MDPVESSPATPQDEKGTQTSRIGIVRDMQQLGTHGKATADELREFLARARGRSPQQVLGMVAGSRLTRSMVLAVVGTVLLLVVGTIVPWLMHSPIPKSQDAATVSTTASEQKKKVEQPAKPQESESEKTTTATADTNPIPSPADTQKAVNVMGLGETRTADPNSNPLEKKLDKLLDNLE